jgi:hypothetical protein
VAASFSSNKADGVECDDHRSCKRTPDAASVANDEEEEEQEGTAVKEHGRAAERRKD